MIGNRPRRVAKAVNQPSLCLIQRPLVAAPDVAPAASDTFSDVLMLRLLQEAVDFERGGVQIEFLDRIRGATRVIAEHVTDRGHIAVQLWFRLIRGPRWAVRRVGGPGRSL